MRTAIPSFFIAAALLLAGCSSGVDSDLKKTPEEVQKSAAAMSDADLQKRVDELQKRGDEFEKKVNNKQPSEEDIKESAKFVEVMGIYATEQAKRKMK